MLETALTIGGSVGGTVLVVIIAFWRLSSDWGKTQAEVQHVQSNVTEVKDDIKSINGKCAVMTEKIAALHNDTNARLTKIETRLNGCDVRPRRRKH